MEHAACNRCQRTFGSASSLTKHLIKPSQCHRPYHVCVKCKKSYASSQSLSNHKRRCNGPESNLCHICKRAFSTHRALANHKRWKCNLNDQEKRPETVAAAGIRQKGKDADSLKSILDSIIKPTPLSVSDDDSSSTRTNSISKDDKDTDDDDDSSPKNSILDRIIKPQLSTKDKKEEEKEENRVVRIIQNLDDVYRTGFKKLLKSLKGSNVANNELILPKILDKLKTLPDADRIELEHFVYGIDQIRVEELVKAVFTYVTKHDQEELLRMIKEIKKSGNDVSLLNELLKMFFDDNYDENHELLLPQIKHIIVNLPIPKTDQLRFQILLKDLSDNRYRIERILTRLNSASTEEEYVDQLGHLTGEKFLSMDQYDQLKKSSRANRDISHVANIIKMSKIGRGIKFLPRTRRGLYESLNSALDDAFDKTMLKKEFLAILDELLHRKEIPKKDYEQMIKTAQ